MHLSLSPIFTLQNIYLESSKMADLKPDADKTLSRAISSVKLTKGDNIDHHVSSSKSKRKLSKSGTRSWFNKSFDQNILQQSTKPVQTRAIRRQQSVTDFFQNVLSMSKSHLQDIFTPKKEKPKHKAAAVEDSGENTSTHDVNINGSVKGAEGGRQHNHVQGLHPNMRHSSLYNSCPSFFKKEDVLTPRVALRPRGSLNKDSKIKNREKRRVADAVHLVSPTCSPSTSNMFLATAPNVPRSPLEVTAVICSSQHRPIVKNQNIHSSVSSYETLKSKLKSSISSLVFPNEGKLIESPTLRSNKHWTPKATKMSSLGFPGSAEVGPVCIRKVSSAPPSRQRVLSTTDLLSKNDVLSKTKRALVKSNSDTFTKHTLLSEPLVKASSEDAHCFKTSMPSLASSMTFLGNIMISVTDYLFLGSVEAAYNERLLCKYNISSLVDMTNVNPTLVPPNKKSDCPCTCVNKTHFRSKLNIGVDDIEWENLEQYFDDINAFIHGARKNGRCVLVFSYLGQSRAPTAVIQHIMKHFKLSYKTALDIVQSKRPQTKLNSGFVKALLRLEKQLGFHDCGMEVEPVDLNTSEEPLTFTHESVEVMDGFSVPPVVRGAWLEC